MRRLLLVGSILALCASCAPAISYTAAADPSRPYSAAVTVGHMIYLSGQVGTDASGKVVSGGIEAETRQTLQNISALLQRHGSSMDKVVKCTVMLTDIGEWGAMNSVYATYFPNRKPVRTAVGVSGLPLGARVEIECWAAR